HGLDADFLAARAGGASKEGALSKAAASILVAAALADLCADRGSARQADIRPPGAKHCVNGDHSRCAGADASCRTGWRNTIHQGAALPRADDSRCQYVEPFRHSDSWTAAIRSDVVYR